MMKRLVHRALALVATLFVATGLGSAAEVAKPIKIGAFLAVTGTASFLGDPEKKTLELFVDRINAEGGVLGRKLELIVYDTGSDPKDAALFSRRLIADDEVDFLIGGTTTTDTMAAVLWLNAHGIPFISLGGASVIIDPVKKWVFKTPHTDRLAIEKVYADMQKRGLSKIGLIGGDSGFDKSCMENASDDELQRKFGITVVGAETFSTGDKDVTPALTKLKSAPGLQAVFFCGFGVESVIVTKNYRQLGIDLPFYHTHGSASMQFITGAGEAAEGVRLPAAALLVAGQLPDSDPEKAPGLAYTKTYMDRYHEAISTFGGHAYDALVLLVDAIKRAGSTDREKVREALENTKNFIGVDGIYNMSPTNHVGLDDASFKMVEVRNGSWKYLY